MTTIYVPTPGPPGSEWTIPEEEGASLRFTDEFGKPLLSSWGAPLRMKLIPGPENKPRRKVDLPWFGSGELILRPRAVDVLGNLCLQVGEMLPLASEEGELFAWNVTHVVDALDEEASELKRFSSGRIMRVLRHAFKAAPVEGAVAFRLPQIRSAIFVGEEFARAVAQAGLTGTAFKEVWRG